MADRVRPVAGPRATSFVNLPVVLSTHRGSERAPRDNTDAHCGAFATPRVIWSVVVLLSRYFLFVPGLIGLIMVV